MKIKLKTAKDIEMLGRSGQILSLVLKRLSDEAREGAALDFLDKLARRLINEAGAQPAFLGYCPNGGRRPFPAAVCLSLNEQVVHGLPSSCKLRNGDLLKIDLGVNYRGYFTDAGVTLAIGKVSASARRLMETVKKALDAAIDETRPGKHLGDIGAAIEKTIRQAGFGVIKGLTGHGIGWDLHEEPEVLNYGQAGQGIELKPGLVLAIEPMAALGKGEIIQFSDDSFAAADGSLTAHFEKTVAITVDGNLILTPM